MNELKLTLELSAEDRANLDAIRQLMERTVNHLFERACAAAEKPEAAPVAEVEKPEKKAPKLERFVAPNPEPEAPKTEEKPEPKVTKDEIRTKVVALVNAKKKDQVMAIIKAHAASVTDLPEDKLDEVMAQLVALEKEVNE